MTQHAATEASPADRRRHPRFPVGIAMDIRSRGVTVEKCRGAIEDLSIGGMSFKTTAQLEAGTTLYLKVNIPLEIRGEVRHIRGGAGGAMNRYGVRFHKIDYAPSESARPDRFIAAKFHK